MKRTAAVFGAVGALILLTGCHRNSESTEFKPQFSSTLAAGSTGDIMNKSALQYGVPIYPGATPETSRYTAGNTTGRTFLTYVTSDSMDKVSQFYSASLNVKPVTSGNVSALQGTTGVGAQVTISVGRDVQSGKTIFTVLAVMRATPAPETMQPSTVVVNTAPAPAAANAPVASGPDTTSPTWNMNTSNSTQGSNDNSDNSQPQGQTDGSNGNDNGQQGQDLQGQTTGDNGNGTDNGNGQPQDNNPPGSTG